MYRIHEIKLSLDEPLETIPQKIGQKVKKNDLRIFSWKIVRESVDARKKDRICKVYTVDFSCDKKLNLKEVVEKVQPPGVWRGRGRPVVVGFGPCGIFAALTLAKAGAKPLVLERGKAVNDRVIDVKNYWERGILNEESNVQFGEGGAGTFSDGKLTTGIHSPYIKSVLETLARAGGGEEITYKQKPHIGTDRLQGVVKNLREEIIKLGGEVRFETKVTSLHVVENQVQGVVCNQEEYIKSNYVIFAIGHSARGTVAMLYEKGIEIQPKPYSMGLRMEHDQERINEAQYGESAIAKILGPAEYQISHRCENGRGVYTFCMCPGGEIIMAASEKETIVTNGMSYFRRNGPKANSALLVDVRAEDFPSSHPLAGIEFQRIYEKKAYELGGGKAPQCLWGDFSQSSLRKALPEFVAQAIEEAMPYLGKKIKGFDDPTARMVGVETRSSSPVKMIRHENYQGNVKGFFPGGEGAGYAGGIVSSAIDGIKIAQQIIFYS